MAKIRVFPIFGVLKYAYLGQAAYQYSVIAVAVKGMLFEQILCEIGHKIDKCIA